MRRSVALACALMAWTTAAPRAGLLFPSVVERITGARIELAPPGGTVHVEIADAELYGIAGLRTTGARIAGSRRAIIFGATLTQVSSPVGDHARVVLEAGFRSAAWQGVVRGGAERLTLDANPPVTWRVAGVASHADVGRVRAIADVEVIEGRATCETSMRLAAIVHAGPAQLVGTVRIDGDRFTGAGVSMVARVHTSLALLAGYDDGAGSLGGGAVITWRKIEIATGLYQHPVLGLSQGVSIACVR